MTNIQAPRAVRAALFAASGLLLLGLAACSNSYGPPVSGQSLTWGQQHYLDNQKALADHDSRRSDRSDHQGSGFHGVP